MKYNQGGFKPPEKRANRLVIILILSFFLIMAGTVCSLAFLVHYKKLSINTETIVAVIALLLSLSTILFYFIEKTYSRFFSTKKTIDITVAIDRDIVICGGLIENSGIKRILNKNVYLVICKGKSINGKYEFGFSLEHEDDNGVPSHKEEYCMYSKIMHSCEIEKCCENRNNKEFLVNRQGFTTKMKQLVRRYNNKINNEEFHKVYVYHGLSKESRLYVDPGEQFSDEIVVKLNAGIYRAMIIWIPEGIEDCACAVKYFNIT